MSDRIIKQSECKRRATLLSNKRHTIENKKNAQLVCMNTTHADVIFASENVQHEAHYEKKIIQ